MTARRRPDPRQLQFLSLLDRVELVTVPEEPSRKLASHNLDQKIRRWLNDAIDASPLTRSEIADSMSDLAGRIISKPMLDTWTGAGRPNRFPADLLPAFCIAAGNMLIMERLAADCGLRMSDTTEARLARLGQWAIISARADEEQRALVAALPPMSLLRGAA